MVRSVEKSALRDYTKSVDGVVFKNTQWWRLKRGRWHSIDQWFECRKLARAFDVDDNRDPETVIEIQGSSN